MTAQQPGRGHRLQGGYVAGTGQHHVGFAAAVLGPGPFPDPGPPGAVRACLVEGEPVEAGLLPGDDHVDVVTAAQHVIGGGQQSVGVRRHVDPDDLGTLVEDVVDEAGVLVREAVVVLTPDVRGEEVVQRGDGCAPVQPPRRAEPLDVLVDHRVDDMGEGLVRGEQAVPAGEEITLQPALAQVFRQDFHHPAVTGQMFVGRKDLRLPGLSGGLVERAEAVGLGLVGPHHPEVPAVGGGRHDVLEQSAQDPGGLVQDGPRPVDPHRVVLEGRERKVAQEQPAVGVRCRPEPGGPLGNAFQDLGGGPALGVEEFLGAVGAHPLLELTQVIGIVPDPGQRHLVGPPGVLDGEPVHLLRAGPALGGAQHDHGPAGTRGRAFGARRALVPVDAVHGEVHGGGQRAVDDGRLVPLDVHGIVAVSAQECVEFVLGQPGQHRGVRDLVPVEVQDGQDRAVVHGVQELVGVPGRGQRSRLRLSVADHTGDQQLGVVEGGAVGMGQRVPQLAALVDGPGSLRCDMAGNTAGEGELLEQRAHPGTVAADIGVRLGVTALQPRVGEDGGAAVAGPPDAHRPALPGPDDPVQMGVDQVQSG